MSISQIDSNIIRIKITKNIPFDYGFAPFPKDADQTNSPCGVAEAQVYVVPMTKAHRLNDIGTWLNGVEEIDDKLLNAKTYGADERDAEIYRKILEHTSANYSIGVLSPSVLSQLQAGVMNHFHKETFQAIEIQIQKDMEKFINAVVL